MRPIYKVLEMVLAGTAFDFTCHAVEDLAKRGEISKKEEKATLKFIGNEVEKYRKKTPAALEHTSCLVCVMRKDPKYSGISIKREGDSGNLRDFPEYVQARKEWIESKIAKLKAQIRKPKAKPMEFKVGDTVKIVRGSKWGGFMPCQLESISKVGIIDGLVLEYTAAADTGDNRLVHIDGVMWWFPVGCLELVK